jgi:hypothetical protein
MLMPVTVNSLLAPAGCSRARLLQRRASAFLGFWVRSAPHDTPRIGTVADQLALPNRVAPRVDRDGMANASLRSLSAPASIRR